MSDSRFYEGTEVLINLLNLRDPEQLKSAEAMITTLQITELRLNPIDGTYDLNHLQAIHKHIFGDVYPWAGQIRREDLEKGTTDFCPADKLQQRAERLFNSLKEERYLAGLNPESFADRAAFYLGEINSLHLFYEGNGRVQREFMYSLAKQAGYELDLSFVPAQEMRTASFDYINGENLPMRAMVAQQILRVDRETALTVIDRHDRLKDILNVSARPQQRTPGRKAKNPDLANEYKNLAKTLIERKGSWPGEVADQQIIQTLINKGYPKFKVENIVSFYSPSAAGKPASQAIEYARKHVRSAAKSLQRGIEW